MELLILFGALIILLVIGVPVAFSLGLASLATMVYLDIPLVVAFQRMAAGMNVFALMAIPFFLNLVDIFTPSLHYDYTTKGRKLHSNHTQHKLKL